MSRPIILAVEDDPASLDLMATRLRGLGCELVTATTPEEAVEAARRHEISLAFVDLNLFDDDQGGIKVIQALRAELPDRRFPIYIHSVAVNYKSEIPRHLVQVDGHLPKPSPRHTLKSLIERLTIPPSKDRLNP